MTDDLHLWSGLYATDALEGDELVLFEEHLVECPDCQAEVAGFRETLTHMAAPVAIAPSDAKMTWAYKNGRVTIKVPQLDIHRVVIIE